VPKVETGKGIYHHGTADIMKPVCRADLAKAMQEALDTVWQERNEG
jgi:hypothetical protein